MGGCINGSTCNYHGVGDNPLSLTQRNSFLTLVHSLVNGHAPETRISTAIPQHSVVTTHSVRTVLTSTPNYKGGAYRNTASAVMTGAMCGKPASVLRFPNTGGVT